MNHYRSAIAAIFVSSSAWCHASFAESPFAVDWIDYSPAPGQFIRDEAFNNPDRALGPPDGAGTLDGNELSVVTLGGFGGSITLAFDHRVEDDPLNPFGVDAIVFGNAFWSGGDRNRHWAECATIEISLDVNRNGEVDDPWYLIPGSHLTDPVTQFHTQTWDDDPSTEDIPPANLSWIPLGHSGTWTTSAYLLPSAPFGVLVVENPGAGDGVEGVYGYGDYTPVVKLGDTDLDNTVDDPSAVPEAFYTAPDDPLEIGITPGSGGGDAFDIAWAIDVETGLPADLPAFDFIRLTNGVNALTVFGEKSPEIDAVADVAPDPFGDYDVDQDIDLHDVAGFLRCFGVAFAPDDPCGRLDRAGDGVVDHDDWGRFVERIAGPR